MPSHSSQGPRQQGLSPGPTASHPKGHLKRNLKRLTKVIIKPLMHMVSDFLRKKMTHIRTYAKKLAEGKDLLPLLQWRHSQQPQTQTSACSLSLWGQGPESDPPALPPMPVEGRAGRLLSRKGRVRPLASCCRQPQAFPPTLRTHSGHGQHTPRKNGTSFSHGILKMIYKAQTSKTDWKLEPGFYEILHELHKL